MATTTTNYKLTKPDIKEKINVGIINQNMDILDSALKEVENKYSNITPITKTSELTNDSGFATESYVNTQISNLVDSAPDTMNTLNELATAIADNDSVIGTLDSAITNKADKEHIHNIVDVTDLQDELDRINNDLVEVSEQSALNAQTLGYSKKNLLKTTNVTNNTVVSGVKFTFNDDGSVTANGTATADVYEVINRSVINHNGKVVISGSKGGASNTYKLYVRNASNTATLASSEDGDSAEFELSSETAHTIGIYIKSGITIDTTFYPMIRDARITDTTYEPYVDDVDTRITQINSDLANYASKTDIPTLVAGDNITLSTDADTNEITISSVDTTYSSATTSTAGLMSASDKTKLDGITASADSVSVTQKLTSGTEIGTVTINGTGTKLYAPTNTDTHYTSKNVVGSSTATSNTTSALTNGNVYINSVENGVVTSSHKISGSGATKVTTDANGNIIITSTDNASGGEGVTYELSKSGSTITLTGSDGSTSSVTDNNTTYSNASLGQGYGTCATAAATVAKVVTLSSYSLTTGGIVSVKFTYAVPASATMNINSKGAKSIYYRGAAITAGVINAGDIATFIYNGSQYHLLTIDTSARNLVYSTTEPTSGLYTNMVWIG